MSRPIRLKEGTFVRVPLDDGTFGYGRVLTRPYMAFYHYQTTEPSADLDQIEDQPLMFKQAVRLFDTDGWVALGTRPLEGEVARPVVSFMQNIGDYTDCVIFDTAGMERRVTPKECVGIERASAMGLRGVDAVDGF